MPQTTISATRFPHRAHRSREDLDPQVGPLLEQLSRLDESDPRRHRLRNTVVRKAMPLADRLARRFDHRGQPLEDLTQVARLGLINAVDNYDCCRGRGFTRFAVPSILGELKRYFRDKGWLVRVPRRLQESRLAFNEAAKVLSQRLGRTPTVADYAEYLSITPDQVRETLECAGAYDGVSLQAPAHRDSAEELVDSLGAGDPELRHAESRALLRPALTDLPERERRILALRFVDDLHQSEIAERVGLSQMHVSRLLRQTLGTLRERIDA